ncbi:MAG: zinc metallopeptidase [Candidatus Atribacteria bacterium]|nr:MAG: zinc metallopeptidase [Candidatus Atribacteria bacterium]
MWFLFGPNAIILIPALILAIYAQWKVRSTYAKYSKVNTVGHMQAQDVAQRILMGAMITNVTIESSQRQLSDHYDPRKRVLRLSAPDSTSVAAIGIAAHEAGHAMQHAQNYGFLSLRTSIVPIANFGSQLAFPLFFIGLFTGMPALVTAGIVAFAAAVLFTLVTLPVEFDASRRAIVALRGSGIVSEEELGGVKEVLFAAALTYVAAAAMAALQLVLLLSSGRRR